MDIEKLVRTTTQELEKLVSMETIIGKPEIIAGKTIIPVCKVTFGFGAGGGEGEGGGKEKESRGSGEGAGAGGGAGITPVAFLIIEKEEVKIYHLKQKGSVASAIEAMAEKCPEMMDRFMETKSGIEKPTASEKKKK